MLGFLKTILTGKIPIIGDLVGMISDGVKAKRDLKRAIELAKIERVNKLDTADIDWDTIQTKNSDSSWKDEGWTLFFMAFILMHYVPALQPYMEAGTKALQDAPDFITYGVPVAIAAAFGRSEVIKWAQGIKKSKDAPQTDSKP